VDLVGGRHEVEQVRAPAVGLPELREVAFGDVDERRRVVAVEPPVEEFEQQEVGSGVACP
jgi:hypothetical protein